MNARPAFLIIALSLAVTACGNKGPLVQPPVPVDTPETPAGQVPVEIEPQTAAPEDIPADALPDPTSAEPLLDPLAEPAPMSDDGLPDEPVPADDDNGND